jgi:hypothetical protein
MNRYDFTKPGGFPFDQGVMQFIQNCISTAAKTAVMAGPFAFLSGGVVTGSNVSDGVVVINGEILPFTGGVIQPKIIIDELATTVAFQDGTPRVVKYVRTARFGDDGTANYPYANFKRVSVQGVLADINDLNNSVTIIDDSITSINAEITTIENTMVKKLASGTEILGNADPNQSDAGQGGTHTISIGHMLADNNYMVLFTILSNSADPQNDLYHNVTFRAKTRTTFDVYFREAAGHVQNISLDWTLIAL